MVGTIQGTPAYMAPEQAKGGGKLDEGCDIYALGGMLYTLLTNKLPIEGDSVADQLSRVLEHEVTPPRRRAPTAGIPPELEAIVLKAMQYERADRYASVPSLRGDIEAYAAAGAYVLYAPGIRKKEDITAVVKAVAPRPVNLLVGGGWITFDEAAALGVRRISIGGALARTAWVAAAKTARQIAEQGNFSGLAGPDPSVNLNELFGKR